MCDTLTIGKLYQSPSKAWQITNLSRCANCLYSVRLLCGLNRVHWFACFMFMLGSGIEFWQKLRVAFKIISDMSAYVRYVRVCQTRVDCWWRSELGLKACGEFAAPNMVLYVLQWWNMALYFLSTHSSQFPNGAQQSCVMLSETWETIWTTQIFYLDIYVKL